MRFNSLDSIRGLAALGVAAFHLNPKFSGYLLVDLFFILSGFVLAYRYFDNPSSRHMSSLDFAVSRFARLYPLHLFTLLIIVAFFVIKGKNPQYADGTLFTFFKNLFLVHNVGLDKNWLSWNEPSWSISVEFWVNMIAFCWLIKHINTLGYFVLSVFGYVIILQNFGHLDVHVHRIWGVLNAGLVRCMAGLCLGIVVFRIFKALKDITYYRNLAFLIIFTILEMCTLLAVIFQIFLSAQKSTNDFLSPILFSLMILIFSFQIGGISKLFSILQMAALGVISYSIYLNHFWIFYVLSVNGIHPESNAYLMIAMVMCAVLTISVITYWLVELPGQKVIKNIYQSFKGIDATKKIAVIPVVANQI